MSPRVMPRTPAAGAPVTPAPTRRCGCWLASLTRIDRARPRPNIGSNSSNRPTSVGTRNNWPASLIEQPRLQRRQIFPFHRKAHRQSAPPDGFDDHALSAGFSNDPYVVSATRQLAPASNVSCDRADWRYPRCLLSHHRSGLIRVTRVSNRIRLAQHLPSCGSTPCQRIAPPLSSASDDQIATSVYNAGFSNNAWMIMEAEQLNIVANRLVDLAQRATELRRYL